MLLQVLLLPKRGGNQIAQVIYIHLYTVNTSSTLSTSFPISAAPLLTSSTPLSVSAPPPHTNFTTSTPYLSGAPCCTTSTPLDVNATCSTSLHTITASTRLSTSTTTAATLAYSSSANTAKFVSSAVNYPLSTVSTSGSSQQHQTDSESDDTDTDFQLTDGEDDTRTRDEILDDFCSEWTVELDNDDRRSLAIFLCRIFTKHFGLKATAAAILVGKIIGKSDKSIIKKVEISSS